MINYSPSGESQVSLGEAGTDKVAFHAVRFEVSR